MVLENRFSNHHRRVRFAGEVCDLDKAMLEFSGRYRKKFVIGGDFSLYLRQNKTDTKTRSGTGRRDERDTRERGVVTRENGSDG